MCVPVCRCAGVPICRSVCRPVGPLISLAGVAGSLLQRHTGAWRRRARRSGDGNSAPGASGCMAGAVSEQRLGQRRLPSFAYSFLRSTETATQFSAACEFSDCVVPRVNRADADGVLSVEKDRAINLLASNTHTQHSFRSTVPRTTQYEHWHTGRVGSNQQDRAHTPQPLTAFAGSTRASCQTCCRPAQAPLGRRRR